MSSVVQMFTMRGNRDGRTHGSGFFEGGTYSSARGSGQVSGGTDKVDYAVGVASVTTDNRVPNNEYDNTTLLANVGVSVSRTRDAARDRPRRAREDGDAGRHGLRTAGSRRVSSNATTASAASASTSR